MTKYNTNTTSSVLKKRTISEIRNHKFMKVQRAKKQRDKLALRINALTERSIILETREKKFMNELLRHDVKNNTNNHVETGVGISI